MGRKAKLKPTRIKIPNLSKDADILIPEVVFGHDGGNGTENTFCVRDGKLLTSTIPNVRVKATGNTLDTDIDGIEEVQIFYADVWIDGTLQRYAFGDNCWRGTDKTVEQFIQSTLRYGSDDWVFSLLVNLCILDAPEDTPLTILTSAPPSMVNQVKDDLKITLLAGEKGDENGKWHIQMSWDKTPRTFIIGKVGVMPEGIGAYAAYAYHLDGSDTDRYTLLPDGTDALSGRVDIHDFGLGTYDKIITLDGEVSVDAFDNATDDRYSLRNQMLDPIIDEINKAFKDARQDTPVLNYAEVDYWLREWAKAKFTHDSARRKIHGLQLSMGDTFQAISKQAASNIIKGKIEPSWRAGADAILLAGGGWEYIRVHIQLAYRDRVILTPWSFEPLKGIEIWDLQAYGSLVHYARMMLTRMEKQAE